MSLQTLAVLSKKPDTPLIPQAINKIQIQSWLRTSVEQLADANRAENSFSTRMEAAYEVAFLTALAVLAASGYRVSAKPGHHEVTLEAASSTIGLSTHRHDEIEAMRKWRNRKYGGLLATKADVDDALSIAEKFQHDVVDWFAKHHPTLLQP
ncbi:hypothetical protein SAMN05216319_2355 [Duganella sp. CF402]|uniref:hypothetical protein n=1 Tax=unclassified Duganella TaxID=2636909 RepID=UPI0008BA0C1E|nr:MULTISPECIES: hypothetical protein [unclassified Duganella]RZT09222.1 hypothetical protein EV582_1266 [Duganella sp. BK701]SEL65884.1 hypothetical protein SAMN05216319_2355 [Duganella sp. CF402]